MTASEETPTPTREPEPRAERTLGVTAFGARRSIDSADASATILWRWLYREGMVVEPGRMAAGVRAMKQALVDNGFGDKVAVDVPVWGEHVTQRTIEFQEHEGLTADGVVGHVTARHLFRFYDGATEQKYGIPDHLVGRQSTAESDNDPVARSSTGDEGRAQINPPSHPQVTLAQMWTPAFASNFTGSYLYGSYIYVGGDWDGAIAAYNVGGALAKKWVAAGKPVGGGPMIVVGGHEVDGWAHCTEYVAGVRAASY